MMRRAFTLIELIFVIVIIGILAAIAVPILSHNREEAVASSCVQEVNQLMLDIAGAYVASPSFQIWQQYHLDENITNVSTDTNYGNGLKNLGNETVYDNTLVYKCDSEAIVTITTENINSHYAIIVKLEDADTLHSISAKKARKMLYHSLGGYKKIKIL